MKQVCFVLVADAFSGGERYTLELAAALNRRIFVKIVGTEGSPLVTAASERGLHTEVAPLGNKLGRSTALRNAMRYRQVYSSLAGVMDRESQHGPIILQYKWEELLWGGRRTSGPTVLLEHGPIPADLLRVPWLRRRLIKAFTSADHVFAVSKVAARSVADVSGRCSDVLPTAVDHERTQNAKGRGPALRESLLADADALAVYAGRIAKNKGVMDIPILASRMPGVRFVVVGTGRDVNALEDEIRRLSVGDRVLLLGPVEDAMPFLAAADLIIHLTTDPGEGRPLVALEAAALGTPMVCWRGIPAMDEIAAQARGNGLQRVEKLADVEACLVAAGLSSREPWLDVATWDALAEEFLARLSSRN